MRLPLVSGLLAGLLVLGGTFVSARSHFPAPVEGAMHQGRDNNPEEGGDWREVLVVNTTSLKYHKSGLPCGSRLSDENASSINGTSLKKARRYVEALGCTRCERCFRD